MLLEARIDWRCCFMFGLFLPLRVPGLCFALLLSLFPWASAFLSFLCTCIFLPYLRTSSPLFFSFLCTTNTSTSSFFSSFSSLYSSSLSNFLLCSLLIPFLLFCLSVCLSVRHSISPFLSISQLFSPA